MTENTKDGESNSGDGADGQPKGGDAAPGSDSASTQEFVRTAASEPPGHVDADPPVASAVASPAAPGAESLAPAPSTARSPGTDRPPAVEPQRPAPDGVAHPMSIVGRSLILAALIGASLVLSLQFTVKAEWVTEFIVRNKLEMDQRMTLIFSGLAGAAVAMLLAAVAITLTKRKGVSIARVERALWFMSPLVFATLLPMLFRYKPWADKYDQLLGTMIFVGLGFEFVATRSARSVPDRISRWIEKIREKTPAFLRERSPLVVVVLAAIGFALFFSFFMLRWHWKMKTSVFDLAINNNLLYAGLEGVFNHSPITSPTDPSKYLGTHAKFGLYLFLPIYALYPKAETIIVIQSTLLGLSAIPLWAFAKKRIGAWPAVLVSLCFLSYYPMHSANFHEVKLVPIATFFVIATVWAVDAKRWILTGLAFAAACAMREDMPIGMAVIALALVLSGHRPRAGMIMLVIAVAWFWFLRFYLMPKASAWWFPKMYQDLWALPDKGFSSVVKTLLTNPFFVIHHLLTKAKVLYVLHLLVPLMFLPMRRFYLWAAFIPGVLLTVMTTDYQPTITFSFQYVMHWTPYLFLAVPLCLASIAKTPDFGRSRMIGALAAMCFATVVLTFNYGAFPMRNGTFRGGFAKINFDFTQKERDRLAALRELISMIPPDAKLSATEKVGAQVSSRKIIYSMRKGYQDAPYILASRRELKLEKTMPFFKRAVKENIFGVVARRADFVLLKKGHDTSGNAKLAKEWRL